MQPIFNKFEISSSIFRSLIKILHCFSNDTLCITFYPKIHHYDFEKPMSNCITQVKNIALTCQKVNAVIYKDNY